MTRAETDYLISALPETAPAGLINWVQENESEELGRDYLIFHNERIRLQPSMEMLMDNCVLGKSIWAAVACCTACGEEIITEKAGRRSFFMADGDDGNSYPLPPTGWTQSEIVEYDVVYPRVEYTDNDGIFCPFCGSSLRIVHRENVRGGRTKQLQVAQLTNVGKYTAVILWLISRTVSEWGIDNNAYPRFAYVLGQKGELKTFTHRRPGVCGKDHPAENWRLLTDNRDRWNARYHDWGSSNDTKVGTAVWTSVPTEREMVGTTGEKTGLLTYWKQGGVRPVEYLKLWRKRKNVENLVNSGFTKMVSDSIKEGLRYGADIVSELEKVADMKQRKPSKMLGLTREKLNLIQKDAEPYRANQTPVYTVLPKRLVLLLAVTAGQISRKSKVWA